MTVRTRRKTPAESPPESPPDTDFDDTSAFRQMGDESTFIRVMRLDDVDKKWVLHGKLSPSETSWERVAELFGGGNYRLIAYKMNEEGKYLYAGQRSSKLPGPYKPPTGPLPGIGTAATVGGVPAGSSQAGTASSQAAAPGVSASEALNTALVSQVIELLKATREQPAAAPVQWGPILSSVTSIVTALITAFTTRRDDDGKVTQMVLAKLERLSERLENPPVRAEGPASNAVADAVSALRELMEVRDMLDGRPGRNTMDPELAVAEKALNVLLAAKMGQTPTGEPPTATPQPAPGAPTATMPIWQRLLLANKKALLGAAMRGQDGGAVAEAILELHIPEQAVGSMKELLIREDCGTVVFQAVPELAEYPKFTEDFLRTLYESLLPEPEPEPAGAVEPGEDDDE